MGEASNAALERARRRGDVALSRRLLSAVGFAAAGLSLPWCISRCWTEQGAALRSALSSVQAPTPPSDVSFVVSKAVLGALVPVGLAVVLGVCAAGALQGAGKRAGRRAAPLPWESASSAALAALLLGATLAGGLVFVVLSRSAALSQGRSTSLSLASAPENLARARHPAVLEPLLGVAADQAKMLLLCAVLALLVFGLLDRLLVLRAWKLRQSAASELLREQRSEGPSPDVRRAQRRAAQKVPTS